MERNKELEFDELLTKYIDDTATEEEENRVLDYVAENKECLGEMIQIAESIRAQRKAERKQRKEVFAYRVAASVALLLVAGGLWFTIGGNNNNGGEMLAQNNVSNEPDIIIDCDLGSSSEDTVFKRQFEPHSLSVGGNNAELHSRPIFAKNGSETEMPGEKQTEPDASVSQTIHPVRHDGTTSAHMASLEVVSSNNQATSGNRLLADCTIPTVWPKGADLEIKWTSNADKVTLTFISVDGETDNREVKGSQGSFIYPATMREQYVRHGSVIKCILTVSTNTDEEKQTGIIRLTEKK